MAAEGKAAERVPGKMNEVFKAVPLASLPGVETARDVVVIDSDSSLYDAVQVLTKNNILAAPVRDVSVTSASAAWHELYLGVFSMTDVVYAALAMDFVASKGGFRLATVSEAEEVAGGKEAEEDPRSLLNIMSTSNYFSSTKVRDFCHVHKFGPFVPVEEGSDDTLLDIALMLGKYRQHRVIVVQPSTATEDTAYDIARADRKLTNIITQSAVVKMLAQPEFAKKLAPVTSSSIQDLGLVNKEHGVVTVGMEDTAISAFRQLATQKISALAVVDGTGRITGALSNRDARVVAHSSMAFVRLHGSVRSLLTESHRTSLDIGHPAITCKPTDTLALVIEKLAVTRIHRVFVVDEALLPIGVVSLSDVLSVLVEEPSPDYFRGFFDETVSASADTDDVEMEGEAKA